MTLDTKEIFKHLDQLRESGKINMYGSAAYVHTLISVQEKFELSRKDAQRVVGEWVQQFSV